jgi:hypothetical protein
MPKEQARGRPRAAPWAGGGRMGGPEGAEAQRLAWGGLGAGLTGPYPVTRHVCNGMRAAGQGAGEHGVVRLPIPLYPVTVTG